MKMRSVKEKMISNKKKGEQKPAKIAIKPKKTLKKIQKPNT
jgi:hypothetical protein